MIGVIANPAEHAVVREFFELFKTPWEFYRNDRQYDVVLCNGEGEFNGTAKLFLLYAGNKTHFDEGQKIQPGLQSQKGRVFSHQRRRIPIYGDVVTFVTHGTTILS